MEHFTDFELFITIILIPFNAYALSTLSFVVFNLPTVFKFKPFNCFTCSVTWIGVVLTALIHTGVLPIQILTIMSTVLLGFIVGYIVDSKFY